MTSIKKIICVCMLSFCLINLYSSCSKVEEKNIGRNDFNGEYILPNSIKNLV